MGTHRKHMSVINGSIQITALGSLQARKVLQKHLMPPTPSPPSPSQLKVWRTELAVAERVGTNYGGRPLMMAKYASTDNKRRLGMRDKMPKIILFLCLFSLEMGVPNYPFKGN